jgi:hypothetical protein
LALYVECSIGPEGRKQNKVAGFGGYFNNANNTDNLYMVYLITILFTVCSVFYTKFQFEDEKAGFENSKGKWHPFRLAMAVLLFAALLVDRYFPFDYWDLAICAGLNVLFDLGVNKFALHVKWFYNGETAKTDKIFGKFKWYGYAVVIVASIIGKIISKNKNKKS